jgi:hypothetical protein
MFVNDGNFLDKEPNVAEEKGKNIHLVFADNSIGAMPDDEDRTEDSKNREKIYDEQISPLIQQVIEICKEHKMPLFIECEFNEGDFTKTCLRPQEWNPHGGFLTLDVIAQCFQDRGVNIDKYLFWVIDQIKEAGGHGSMFMSQLGYRAETGEYDWDQANNMLQGAKPRVEKPECLKKLASRNGEKYVMHSCACSACQVEDRLYDKMVAAEKSLEG